jgi:hypothetical protein
MTSDLGFGSPVPSTGDNLATFLGARLAASFGVLDCTKFGLTDPVNATTDANGVATSVTYSLTQQTATVQAAGTTTPTASPSATPTVSPSAAPPTRKRHHR